MDLLSRCVSHLLQCSRYLLALQQVGRLDVDASWRSLDVQLQLCLWLLLHQQLLPQLLHHLLLQEEEREEEYRYSNVQLEVTRNKISLHVCFHSAVCRSEKAASLLFSGVPTRTPRNTAAQTDLYSEGLRGESCSSDLLRQLFVKHTA